MIWGYPYFSKPPSAIIGSTIKSPGPSRAIHQIPLRPRQEHVIGMWPTLWPFHMQSTGDQLLGPRWIIRDRKQNKIYCHICLWNYLTKYPSPKQTSDFIPCHMGRIIPWFHVSYMASEKGVPHSIRGLLPHPQARHPEQRGDPSLQWPYEFMVALKAMRSASRCFSCHGSAGDFMWFPSGCGQNSSGSHASADMFLDFGGIPDFWT